MTTIHDIAKLAGVSTSAVSRVLNGYSDIGEETRQKIWKIVKQLDYHPNVMARGLAMKRSWLIGLCWAMDDASASPDLQGPFFGPIIQGVNETIGKKGFDLVLFSADRNSGHDLGLWFRNKVIQRRVDAYVLLGRESFQDRLESLRELPIPSMFLGVRFSGTRSGYIESDNCRGAKQVIHHLAELGHKRIGLIASRGIGGTQRMQGALVAFQELGLQVPDDLIVHGDYSRESGYIATQSLLRLGAPPTAIFAFGDQMAYGAIDAAREMGFAVPKHLSVVGFADIETSKHFYPPLTTVRQSPHLMGVTAANSLVDMIDDPQMKPPELVVPVELVIRGSTDVVTESSKRE